MRKSVKFGTFQQLSDFIFALQFEKDFEVSKNIKTLKTGTSYKQKCVHADNILSSIRYFKSKEIKQKLTGAKNFGNYFCAFFGCHYKSFLFAGKTEH